MILIGIVIGMFVRNILPDRDVFANDFLYSVTIAAVKIVLLPLTMGIGYEILMLAGKHDNIITRMISAPGLWVQRITTKEPTEDMLEVAIVSIKCALRDEFPEFNEFFENEGWKPETESADEESKKDGDEAGEALEAQTDGNIATESDIIAESEHTEEPDGIKEESENEA